MNLGPLDGSSGHGVGVRQIRKITFEADFDRAAGNRIADGSSQQVELPESPDEPPMSDELAAVGAL